MSEKIKLWAGKVSRERFENYIDLNIINKAQTEKLKKVLLALDTAKHALADIRYRLPLRIDDLNMVNQVICETENVLFEIKP